MQLLKYVTVKDFLLYFCLGLCLLSTPVSALPDSEELQAIFERAINARDTGKTFEAIELFETILSNQPTLNRVRLELAIAYHQATRYEDALRELKVVLDNPDTPENVRLSILAYLGQLTSDERKPAAEHRLSYFVKAGVLHNTNVNITHGSGTSVITSNPVPDKISSAASDITLSASHRYLLHSPYDVYGAATYFEWQSQLGLSSLAYSSASDFNQGVFTLSTGPALIAPGRWRALFDLRIDQVSLSGSSLLTISSLAPAITFDLGHFRNLTVESAISNHRYTDAVNNGRDGNEFMLGSGYNQLLDNISGGLEVGLRVRSKDADIDGFSYNLTEVYVNGFSALSPQAVVYLRSYVRVYDYAGADPVALIARDETEASIALGYNRDLHAGILRHWTFNLELAHTANESNVSDFDYDLWLVSTNLSRYFQ